VTPSEALSNNRSVGEVDVPELATVSWADVERGSGSWLGNTMQWAYYVSLRNQQQLVSEAQEPSLQELWRHFQTSDHLYYMFTSGGGPGEVHSYFNPFGSPSEAFVACFSALLDFDSRLKDYTIVAKEAFSFYVGVGEEKFTGISVRSLKGFRSVLKHVQVKSLEFHNQRGDFEMWFRFGLGLSDLADAAKKIASMRGSQLREALQKLIDQYVDNRSYSRSGRVE
jgi:alpha-amylase